jgi:hypothetical protein
MSVVESRQLGKILKICNWTAIQILNAKQASLFSRQSILCDDVLMALEKSDKS